MLKARKTILCIEGDCEAAALIAEELVDRGFAVDVAHDGHEGIAAILQQTLDLVLCDISMPFMSGFDVLERLTEVAPGFGYMPFVFLTALTDRENELKGRRLGADDYVTKPVDFDIFVAIGQYRLARAPRNKIPRIEDPRHGGCRSGLPRSGTADAAVVDDGAFRRCRPIPGGNLTWHRKSGAAAPRHCRRRRHDDRTLYVADRRARASHVVP